MTTPILPEFVLRLFQEEIDKVVKEELQKVCVVYKLDYEDVCKKIGRVELEPTKQPGFRIIKKNETFAPKEVRCAARMLHDLEVKQCSKKRCDCSTLCARHLNMQRNDRLKYGTIDDPLPDELRPEILDEKRKSKIY